MMKTPNSAPLLAALAVIALPALSRPTFAGPQAGQKAQKTMTAGKATQDHSASHKRMVAALQGILDETDDTNALLGSVQIRKQKVLLEKLSEDAPVKDRFRLLVDLAVPTVYYGEEREGLELFKQAFALDKKDIPDDLYNDGMIKNAEAWLRLAETENCCASHNKESCILPLRGAAVHTKPEGSTNAIKLLTQVLENTEKNSDRHLKCQWMINMAWMTLGGYPDKVPEAYRISESFFKGKAKDFPRFVNVATEVGLDYLNLAGGAIGDDFDNDGDLDLMLSGYGSDGQLQYFINEGGHFRRYTEEAGLTGLYGGLNILQADYDNDGFLDVYVPRGAWLGKIGLQPDSLLHNNGDNTFTDVAFEVGLNDVLYPNVTACFADYDNDGDLDIFVGNENGQGVTAPCQLFQNQGNGKFVDVGKKAGITNDRYTRGVVAGDYDADGDPDFYVTNLGEDNRLYRNNGDGTFTDVAPQLGVVEPRNAYPSWFFDYNNDGVLDLEVMAFGARPGDIAASALNMPYEADLPRLYIGDGKGGFKNIAQEAGLTEPFSVMGANVGDFDNDGWLDFYGGTGRPEARDLVPDKAYHNLGGKGYEDITYLSGLGNLQKGHGRSFADFDGDGDLDIVAQMGGAFRADLFYNSLYENPGFGNNWLAVKLEGTKSNRCAIGAQVRADFVDNGVKRSVYRTVNSGGSFGANPLRVHIGLGKATLVDTLEVTWPTSKTTQVFKDVQPGQLLHIVESVPEKMALKAFKLGTAH